ncbi:3-oxoacyl-[acyl-carrier-protein] synthase 3 protein 1 [Collibacillus ludicampi]|uniref:Beta-ketoacyl-[acyl-carrier-protein] synthase III n=1 Tax=Collibacillus ludicampi TaxID=2771369 RepID=A0AAV4LKN6_9BACL|nr:beta-ketoacyl-ACP synthase III [Collibacillus ludicampi]GIM48366.1 3-oxoacyl-[acyl-carrier-protein] synthase 3 protein 1 [Collibacillus ludicampi]
MNLYRAGITGIGVALPEKRLTNHDLEKMVDTSDEWIVTRTGIRERRIVTDGERTSDLATRAAERALLDAGVAAEQLDMIIVASVTPDLTFPPTACLVQERIGASKAACFDLEATCSGFVYGVSVAAQFIMTGAYQKVLVIGAETLSTITDYTDRNTCVLFGDGAGAAVIERVPEEFGILSFELGADGSGAELLKREHTAAIEMNGREVFKFATRTMGEAAKRVMNKAGWESQDVNLLVPHQANVRIIEEARRRTGLKEEQVYVNIHKYGNTSSATIPIALREALDEGRLKTGDRVVLVAFGGGMTWAAMALVWGK